MHLILPVGLETWVQLLSHVRLFAAQWTAASQASLSCHQFPELTQTHVHRVSDAIQPSHPLSSPSPPAFSLSQHQDLFQWVSSSHQVPEYWSASFSISPSNPIEVCGYKSTVRAVSIAAYFQIYSVVLIQRWNKKKVDFTKGWNFARQKQKRWGKEAESMYMKTT